MTVHQPEGFEVAIHLFSSPNRACKGTHLCGTCESDRAKAKSRGRRTKGAEQKRQSKSLTCSSRGHIRAGLIRVVQRSRFARGCGLCSLHRTLPSTSRRRYINGERRHPSPPSGGLRSHRPLTRAARLRFRTLCYTCDACLGESRTPATALLGCTTTARATSPHNKETAEPRR